jgi:ribosomal protein L9
MATFTRSFRKILLLEDVENLGFKGEIAYVKPGYAFNSLVPLKKAIFFSDQDTVEEFKKINVKQQSL